MPLYHHLHPKCIICEYQSDRAAVDLINHISHALDPFPPYTMAAALQQDLALWRGLALFHASRVGNAPPTEGPPHDHDQPAPHD